MIKHCTPDSGFTLIEMIMALVLMGILGAVGTLGISTFIKNFNTGRQGTDTASSAQMALLRIAKEITAATEVFSSGSDDDEIKFETKHLAGTSRVYRIYISGSDLLLTEYDPDDNTTITKGPDVLLENVTAFSLQYYAWNAGNAELDPPTSAWTGASTPTCGSSVPDIHIQSSGDRECEDDGGDNEVDIKFHFHTAHSASNFIIYYGGEEYYACKDGSEYRGSDEATSSADCSSNSWNDKIKEISAGSEIPYYGNFWIYPEGEPECATSAYSLRNDPSDLCTLIGNTADNTAPTVASSTAPLTRLVDVSLTLEDISAPFTVSLMPRNLEPLN